MKPEHYKEFNAEHAKAGAPYCQRNRLAARIGIWDAHTDCLNDLIGVATCHDGCEYCCVWMKDGTAIDRKGVASNLVMLPLGYCEGKPVFVGEKLKYFNGIPVTVHSMNRNFEGFIWPRKAPVMPVLFDGIANFSSEELQLFALKHRRTFEFQWKALDEFNGVKE